MGRLAPMQTLPFTFDAPWSKRSRINRFNEETQNPSSDCFGFKNPILDFLKEKHLSHVLTGLFAKKVLFLVYINPMFFSFSSKLVEQDLSKLS